jgi:hypothetical protein
MGAPNIEEFTEADIAKLEQEVEDLLKNRFSQNNLDSQAHPGLVNIKGVDANFARVTKSAYVGTRPNLMLSSSNKKNYKRFRGAAAGNGQMAHPDEFNIPASDLGGGHIYEDAEYVE